MAELKEVPFLITKSNFYDFQAEEEMKKRLIEENKERITQLEATITQLNDKNTDLTAGRFSFVIILRHQKASRWQVLALKHYQNLKKR